MAQPQHCQTTGNGDMDIKEASREITALWTPKDKPDRWPKTSRRQEMRDRWELKKKN